MNPILAQIALSLFYLAIFIVVCSVLTNCIKQIIHEIYASRTTYVKLTTGEQTPEQEAHRKSVNDRIAKALADQS